MNRHSFFREPLYQLFSGHCKKFSARFEHKLIHKGLRTQIFFKRGIHFAVLAHIVGWVKRDVGTIYVGFAYLNAPQEFGITTKLANPIPPQRDLTQPTIYRLGPQS